MKKMHGIFGLFCLLVVVQIAAPVSLIVKHENTLRYGEQFKFKTAPVDPYDAFRGRYVALGFEERKVLIPEDLYQKRQALEFGQKIFAVLEQDENGFARFTSLSLTRPEEKPYIKTRIHHIEVKHAVLDMPFNRYYMDEELAPIAERIYRERSRATIDWNRESEELAPLTESLLAERIGREKHDAYVTVRIKSGYAVLEQLYIDGVPIKEFIQKTPSLNKEP